MSTHERLKQILAGDYNLAPEKLAADARLEDLGIDSLGVMELLFKIEDEFHIRMPPPSDQLELATIADLVACIDRLLAERSATASSASGAL